MSVENEWKAAAAKGRARTMKRALGAVGAMLAMFVVAVFFFTAGNMTFAVLSAAFGVVFAIWIMSGNFGQQMSKLLGIR